MMEENLEGICLEHINLQRKIVQEKRVKDREKGIVIYLMMNLTGR
jgi:hypothetical protein